MKIMNMFYEDYYNGKTDKKYKPYCVNFKTYEDSVNFINYLNSLGFEIVMEQCYGYHTVLVNFELKRVSGIHMPCSFTTPDKVFDYEDFIPILQNYLNAHGLDDVDESADFSQQDQNTNYKKLYYENKNSTKIYPYHVILNKEESEEAVVLLKSLGFKRVETSNSNSFDLYVNLQFKRFSPPCIAFWYMGSRGPLHFEDLKALLAQHFQNFSLN